MNEEPLNRNDIQFTILNVFVCSNLDIFILIFKQNSIMRDALH